MPFYMVQLADGTFAGRYNLTEPLGSVPAALASCFDSKEDAEQVAATFDGSTVVTG